MKLVACRTGVDRHAPDLSGHVEGEGAELELVDCFDRCTVCELSLLVRIDGAMLRFRKGGPEVAEAIRALKEE